MTEIIEYLNDRIKHHEKELEMYRALLKKANSYVPIEQANEEVKAALTGCCNITMPLAGKLEDDPLPNHIFIPDWFGLKKPLLYRDISFAEYDGLDLALFELILTTAEMIEIGKTLGIIERRKIHQHSGQKLLDLFVGFGSTLTFRGSDVHYAFEIKHFSEMKSAPGMLQMQIEVKLKN